MNNSVLKKYINWHCQGMTMKNEIIDEIIRLLKCAERITGAARYTFIDDESDTFEYVQIGYDGKAMCSAKLDDGAPMGYYLDHLALNLLADLLSVIIAQNISGVDKIS